MRAASLAVGALALVSVGGVYVVSQRSDGSSRRAAPAAPTVPTTAPRPLDADQTEVRGTVTRIVGTGVAGPVLALPVTLEVARGGGTKATFNGARIDGAPKTAAWDGGRPLPISGTGSLDLGGPADVEVTPEGTRWSLDGSARKLTAGTYTFGATVAVGTIGLSTPRDGVSLVAQTGVIVTTRGGVTTTVPRGETHLTGPGSLVLEGSLTVRTTTGTRQARSVRFGPGVFELTLKPTADGGLAIDESVLQGQITVGG